MLQAIVFIAVLVAVLLLIDGVFAGFSLLSHLIGGLFTFIFKGLGIVIAVGLAMYLVLLAIF
tara:strand:+ start:24 stop:209 length:186 start_codon:yes stop_codon:yes gene_type:complete